MSRTRAVQPSRLFNGADRLEWQAEPKKDKGQQIEVIIVMAAHQPFGLLMNQVYNIVRPQGAGVQILRQPNAAKGRFWGEIEYQSGRLRVLELARMLLMPLVEPIDRSKILLTGKLQQNGTIEQQFGLAVDDILSVQQVGLDQLRLLPGWLCQKRLGKLVWGVALVEREALAQQSSLNQLHSEGLLVPLQVTAFIQAGVGFEKEPTDWAEPRTLLPAIENERLSGLSNMPESDLKDKPRVADTQYRPVILLDLDVLKNIAYKAE